MGSGEKIMWTTVTDMTIIIINLNVSSRQKFDCPQLKMTISGKEMFHYWSLSSFYWLPAWLEMIKAAAWSQTARCSSQREDELSAADYKRRAGEMRRLGEGWRKKKKEPLDDSSPPAASLILCQYCGWFAAGSGHYVTLKHDHSQSWLRPPWLPGIHQTPQHL